MAVSSVMHSVLCGARSLECSLTQEGSTAVVWDTLLWQAVLVLGIDLPHLQRN